MNDQILLGNSTEVMQGFPADSVDLVVTSPPYDDLRDYKGYEFDAGEMLGALHRVVKPGGVCVWVVGDRIKGGWSLTSFGHALTARDIGWRVHDVMIYQKKQTPFMRKNAYTPSYEWMFVFSKGRPKTFNPLMEAVIGTGGPSAHNKGADGANKYRKVVRKERKVRNNIWPYAIGLGGSTADKDAFDHPAIFPEKLAADHILSWTNPGDLVLDPMCGSGTTPKMAALNDRRWLGIDMSAEYVEIARKRVAEALRQGSLTI